MLECQLLVLHGRPKSFERAWPARCLQKVPDLHKQSVRGSRARCRRVTAGFRGKTSRADAKGQLSSTAGSVFKLSSRYTIAIAQMPEASDEPKMPEVDESKEGLKMPKAEDHHLLHLDLWAANFVLPLILRSKTTYTTCDWILWLILIRVPLFVVLAMEFMLIWMVENIVQKAEIDAWTQEGDCEDWDGPHMALTPICLCIMAANMMLKEILPAVHMAL